MDGRCRARAQIAGDPKLSQMRDDIILEARAVTRRYGGTIALKAVDFSVYRNQVNVLIGENGAGKSTLMRILAGVETPDEGELLLEGVPIALASPRDAVQHGISIVHQELSVFSNLDLADNIFAGREEVRAGIVVDRKQEERRSLDALRRLRKPMNIRHQAGHLSLGSRQIIELARSLDQRTKILILDEPTSALSNAEAEALFNVIDDLKRSGVTIIYISHRLNELLHLGDRFTVLRSGRVVGEAPRSSVTRQWIVERMSGRDIADRAATPSDVAEGPSLLRVERLTYAISGDAQTGRALVRGVSLSVRAGEIVGIYGLLGAGRTELLECIAGLSPPTSGAIFLREVQLRLKSAADGVKAGIHLVPEDRQRDGLVPDLTIRENIALASKGLFLIDRKKEATTGRQLAKELNIAVSDLELPVTALSGGNQQKVLIARCLMCSPSLLLLDEPTRGVDVGAKADIYGILRRLAKQGIGILFASSEIEETQALADRVLVLCQGHLTAELDRSQIRDEALFAAASPSAPSAPRTQRGAAFA
jgi:erythritol transport system ATP-binding protein